MAGEAPRTIQLLAGHVSVETTMRYVAKAAPAQAIAALDERVAPGGYRTSPAMRSAETTIS